MNAAVVPAFEMLLAHEGGYAPQDNGRGAVNFGVTQLTLDDIRQHGGGWAELPADVKDLTRPQVFDIFRDAFWFQSGAGKLKDQRLATAYSNLYYQTSPAFGGISNATKALQRAVGAREDGIFGPATERAVNAIDPAEALKGFKREMLVHYEGLVERYPEKYGKSIGGWKKRLEGL